MTRRTCCEWRQPPAEGECGTNVGLTSVWMRSSSQRVNSRTRPRTSRACMRRAFSIRLLQYYSRPTPLCCLVPLSVGGCQRRRVRTARRERRRERCVAWESIGCSLFAVPTCLTISGRLRELINSGATRLPLYSEKLTCVFFLLDFFHQRRMGNRFARSKFEPMPLLKSRGCLIVCGLPKESVFRHRFVQAFISFERTGCIAYVNVAQYAHTHIKDIEGCHKDDRFYRRSTAVRFAACHVRPGELPRVPSSRAVGVSDPN
jgi:hypothetical protein